MSREEITLIHRVIEGGKNSTPLVNFDVVSLSSSVPKKETLKFIKNEYNPLKST